jgi:hypothetical protein
MLKKKDVASGDPECIGGGKAFPEITGIHALPRDGKGQCIHAKADQVPFHSSFGSFRFLTVTDST